ncbi:MAG: MmgE/PrpD family protein [Deltaproteobacteria bacterium]|nr:MmgE/PrpD family protein [Deltaproteobacteria bacterium]MDZ4343241.1 MmgE/PrpD family protein [Candidatus Binatia bacterium]
MEPYSQAIGRFVSGLRLAEVPAPVIDKAKLVFLDTLGVALASSTMDFGAMVTRVAQRLGGTAASRVIGSPIKVAAANAVIANGTLAHGLDYDDTLEEAVVHTGSCAWMTALAVGEELGASGAAVLESAIAATEVLCKVGLVAPGKFHARGFHPTAICSTFGAAAAAGKLYGLTAAQWSDAFGLCGSQSSGIIEYLADGTWTKRLHPGWSAHGGVIATLLAREGFRGPGKVFEGTHGFFHAFGGQNDYRFEKLTELGKQWEIPRLAFKSYPCGSISHPYMDCALKLKQKFSPAPEKIAEVVCRTAEGPVHRLWEPLADKQRPVSSYGAKFSLPYSIAVMLVHGRAGLDEFTEEAIRDPIVLALARKVRYALDPTIDYPRHFSGHVKITVDDGTVLEENQPHPRGGQEDPLPPEEIEKKFRANAGLALSAEKIEQIMATARRLEQVSAISALTDLLSP